MRSRLTITIKEELLTKLDKIVDHVEIRNRSHAIEYLLNKALYSQEITALVLAGGEGTRMRPFTYEMPKCLLPVANKPLLNYLLELLKQHGVKDIVLAVGKQGSQIKAEFANGQRLGVNIEYSEEESNLGTGGAIKAAQKLIKSSPFVVVYGDVYTELDLRELISFHQKSGNVVTLALAAVKDPRQFGQIELKGNQVTAFYQSPQEGQTNLINLGVYICSAEIFELLPSRPKFSWEGLLVELVAKHRVGGYVSNDLWFDVGTPDDYSEVIKAIMAQRKS